MKNENLLSTLTLYNRKPCVRVYTFALLPQHKNTHEPFQTTNVENMRTKENANRKKKKKQEKKMLLTKCKTIFPQYKHTHKKAIKVNFSSSKLLLTI